MKIEGYQNINLPRDKPGDSTCQNHLPSSALQLSINKPFSYDVKVENYLILEVLAPGRHSCEYLWDLLSRFGRQGVDNHPGFIGRDPTAQLQSVVVSNHNRQHH